ncbi:hypothetical protein AU15_03205 [Marinobacter salarius]|uniref:Uncharacterized protein n=1 Tax=Marinobacter salarius TaxID=1420917 RepID=W5YVA8_9GAMM|nr:hypothetical protein AU15_03205 [Marinobacter salarius]
MDASSMATAVNSVISNAFARGVAGWYQAYIRTFGICLVHGTRKVLPEPSDLRNGNEN